MAWKRGFGGVGRRWWQGGGSARRIAEQLELQHSPIGNHDHFLGLVKNLRDSVEVIVSIYVPTEGKANGRRTVTRKSARRAPEQRLSPRLNSPLHIVAWLYIGEGLEAMGSTNLGSLSVLCLLVLLVVTCRLAG